MTANGDGPKRFASGLGWHSGTVETGVVRVGEPGWRAFPAPRYGCSLGLPKRGASWRPGEPVSRPVRIQSPARRLRPALLIIPMPPITPSTCLTFPQLLLRLSFSSQPPARSHQNNNIPLRQHRPLPPFIDIQLHSFSRLPFRIAQHEGCSADSSCAARLGPGRLAQAEAQEGAPR